MSLEGAVYRDQVAAVDKMMVEISAMEAKMLHEGELPLLPQHPDLNAVTVRELSDADLLASLKNVGCYLADCDACAEVFFTGAKTRQHTCPRPA